MEEKKPKADISHFEAGLSEMIGQRQVIDPLLVYVRAYRNIKSGSSNPTVSFGPSLFTGPPVRSRIVRLQLCTFGECKMTTYCRRSEGGGINPLPPNSETWLVQYEVGAGLQCGICSRYRPTGIPRTVNGALEKAFLNTIGRNDAIVDPEAPQRVARDAAELRHRGQVLLARRFDPWCRAVQKYHLGGRFMEAILNQEDWFVQVQTKNSAIVNDFHIANKHRHRVSIGMVFTAPASRAAAMTVLEPHGSSNPERMGALWRAHDLGLGTHAVVESLLPRTSDSESHIDELVGFAAECGVEMILAKPLNVRGLTLRRMQKALAKAGYTREAEALESVKTRKGWSRYATEMALNFQRSCLKLYELGRLRFFLRPSQLVEEDISRLEMSDHGIHWIGGRRRRYVEVR